MASTGSGDDRRRPLRPATAPGRRGFRRRTAASSPAASGWRRPGASNRSPVPATAASVPAMIAGGLDGFAGGRGRERFRRPLRQPLRQRPAGRRGHGRQEPRSASPVSNPNRSPANAAAWRVARRGFRRSSPAATAPGRPGFRRSSPAATAPATAPRARRRTGEPSRVPANCASGWPRPAASRVRRRPLRQPLRQDVAATRSPAATANNSGNEPNQMRNCGQIATKIGLNPLDSTVPLCYIPSVDGGTEPRRT